MIKNLKIKRLKAGLTQMELARKAKMGRYNISLAENNNRNLSKEETVKIKAVLLKCKGGKIGHSNKKK